MCWTTWEKENAVPKVSDGSVKCRKVCCKCTSGSDAGIASWVYGFRYETGKTYRTEMGDALRIGTYILIGEGFHSYAETAEIRMRECGVREIPFCVDITECGEITDCLYPSMTKSPVILECSIPEGASYCENEYGEIVSEAITVDSITII